MTKHCPGCEQTLPLSAFPARRDRPGGSGVESRCRDCRRALHRAWRASEPGAPTAVAYEIAVPVDAGTPLRWML